MVDSELRLNPTFLHGVMASETIFQSFEIKITPIGKLVRLK